MMAVVIDILGTLGLLLGWAIIIYALWRNQRVAKKSPKVDDTNFIPRVAAVVEVTLHPDRAATWVKITESAIDPAFRLHDLSLDEPVYFQKVFPALGQDLSEQTGVREDDNITT
jgi:hypothetical protein